MAENSGIEWTHHTFNPWIGCTKVSSACDNCYAEVWDNRFNPKDKPRPTRWGAHADRTRTKTWSNPIKWNKQAEVELTRYRVFCASLADVFDNHRSIKQEWRNDLWKLIKDTPHLDWLLLTKRPQNIKRYLPDDWGNGYPNVWLGITAENQQEYDRRIAVFSSISSTRKFLSLEPLLGPINLDLTSLQWECGHIDWVIVGGENHTNPRPLNPEWVRDLRDQCKKHHAAFLFKQWSGNGQKEIKAKGRELDGVVHTEYPANSFYS